MTEAGLAAAREEPGAGARSVPVATFELVALHSLVWLAAGAAVGLLLSLLLLVPRAGALLGPVGYGRWAPVHLDLMLYGWCGLPLAGLLLRLYHGEAAPGRAPALAVHAWSGALATGAVSWLAGETTGKLFLDWKGPARGLWLAALAGLAAVLLAGLVRPAPGRGAGGQAVLALLWVGLAAVPVVFWLATDPRTYPPINPASGGPTGGSLLGSTLGIVWIFLLAPWALGRHRPEAQRATALAVAALALHTGFFLALGRGDHGHREPLQIAALASLLPWAWGVPAYLRRFAWSAGERRWLTAFLLWAGALLASGLVAFLPGVLERAKFTHSLVAHAHVAMAGMATSFSALLLAALNRGTRLAALFEARGPFLLWQGATVLHVTALVAVGALEAVDPGILFRPTAAIPALFALRSLAGTGMLAAALAWLGRGVRELA